jgi:hypothetical protein
MVSLVAACGRPSPARPTENASSVSTSSHAPTSSATTERGPTVAPRGSVIYFLHGHGELDDEKRSNEADGRTANITRRLLQKQQLMVATAGPRRRRPRITPFHEFR